MPSLHPGKRSKMFFRRKTPAWKASFLHLSRSAPKSVNQINLMSFFRRLSGHFHTRPKRKEILAEVLFWEDTFLSFCPFPGSDFFCRRKKIPSPGRIWMWLLNFIYSCCEIAAATSECLYNDEMLVARRPCENQRCRRRKWTDLLPNWTNLKEKNSIVTRYNSGTSLCADNCDHYIPSHVRNDISSPGTVHSGKNGVIRYRTKKGSQQATKPPTTIVSVWVVLLSLLNEDTLLDELYFKPEVKQTNSSCSQIDLTWPHNTMHWKLVETVPNLPQAFSPDSRSTVRLWGLEDRLTLPPL